MNKIFVKNYYYNRVTLLKFIHMYNYLNKITFLETLSSLIHLNSFFPNEKKTETLLEIHSKLLPNIIKLDLNFGFVWIFEEKIIFYFKNDFDFDDFYCFFFNLEKDYNVKWGCIEFFDKDIKIIEIFAKNSLFRSFRSEVLIENKRNVLKGFTENFINCKDSDFLFFLKDYNPKNMKLIVYFYKNIN